MLTKSVDSVFALNSPKTNLVKNLATAATKLGRVKAGFSTGFLSAVSLLSPTRRGVRIQKSLYRDPFPHSLLTRGKFSNPHCT